MAAMTQIAKIMVQTVSIQLEARSGKNPIETS